MESNIEYLRSLKEEAISKREKELNNNIEICQQLKVLKSQDPNVTSAKIDLGLYDTDINYNEIERNLCKESPIPIYLNKYIKKECTGKHTSFCWYYYKHIKIQRG